MEQPILHVAYDDSLAELGKQIERYYFLDVDLLSEIERSVATHHNDIGTHELQRGIAYLRSAFHYASTAKAT